MRGAHRVRSVANWANLSTPSGLLLARIGAGRPRRARNGVWLAHGYHLPVPPAPAFTLGSVVFLRAGLPGVGRDPVGAVPRRLLDHEERHVTQYAWCGGVLMPVAYLAAAGWSWLRTGDFASRNAFERRAGLADGGYRERPVRPLRLSRADNADMEAAALLEAYDSQLREDAEVGRAVSVLRHPPLLWAVFGDQGMITYRSLAGVEGQELDALIDASLSHFRDGTDVRSAEWKSRGHDAPEDLAVRLTAHGFQAREVETVMIGPAAELAVDVAIPAEVTIRRVEVGPNLIDDVARASTMQTEVFGGRAGHDASRVADQISADPVHLQLWVAESGGQVVAAGTLDVVRGTEFAGLWGGAVLATWRGRGIYRALVAARARAAVDLGVRLLHSDCTAMSRPILERSGLIAVTTTTPYVWTRPDPGVPDPLG